MFWPNGDFGENRISKAVRDGPKWSKFIIYIFECAEEGKKIKYFSETIKMSTAIFTACTKCQKN